MGITESWEIRANDGRSLIAVRWHVVRLWELSAEAALGRDDVGVFPFVPLMASSEPPELLLRRCRERIEELAPPERRDSLLVTAQVFARARYNELDLLSIFGGMTNMFDLRDIYLDDVYAEIEARTRRRDILRCLRARFGELSPAVEGALNTVKDAQRLEGLIDVAVVCPSLDEFILRVVEAAKITGETNGETAA